MAGQWQRVGGGSGVSGGSSTACRAVAGGDGSLAVAAQRQQRQQRSGGRGSAAAAATPWWQRSGNALGLYVDDLVYFSPDLAVEHLFCRLLAERCKVDFMGIVEWFLGVHFSWPITSSSVAIHLNQSGFATNLVESFARQSRDITPTATPYQSGIHIDSIAPSLDADNSPAQIRWKEAYQSLVGSLGWLSSSTHPDITAAHSFLSSYTNKPAAGHMKAALYVLHYIHSTHDYGISFTMDDVAPMHSYVHYPPKMDAEAYHDAVPPSLGRSDTAGVLNSAAPSRTALYSPSSSFVA